jgi:hypothetical protein
MKMSGASSVGGSENRWRISGEGSTIVYPEFKKSFVRAVV